MKKYILAVIGLTIFATSCNKINLLTLQQEKQLGLQAKQQLASQVAPRSGKYLQAYQLLESMRDDILRSGEIKYKDEFAWEINLIDEPTLNAFCTPGGHIYFYTGLMKYVDNSSAIAGVMGHEMAHADKRHSGKQITNQMGLDILLSIVAGTAGTDIAQVTGLFTQLGQLKYGRAMETESDESSVKYLCPTKYQTDGAHYFFQKLLDEGQTSNQPTFLSTHPHPQDRVDAIKTEAAKQGSCVSSKTPYTGDNSYKSLVSTL